MIRDFIASIVNINEYHRLKNKSAWKVLLYLTVISLLFGLIFSGTIQSRYNKILLMIPENYDTKVPEFIIEKGELKLPGETKTIIEQDKGAMIFDVSGESSLDKYEYGLLFLKDRYVIKTSKWKEDTRYWNDFNLEGFDKATVRQMLGSIPLILALVTSFLMIGLLIVNLVSSLLIAIALMLARKLWKKDVTFSQLFKMAAHSMTLPSVLIVILSIILGDRIGLTKYYYTYYLAVIYVLIALRRGEIKTKKASK
jgi:fluoride ion exporter CrcB/FEX